MNKRTRLIFLGLSLLLLIGVGRFVTHDFDFLLNDFWFTSGFLLLILLSLIDQPHFSKDSSIFINAVTAGISLLLISEENRNWVFWLFLGITLYLALSSYILMWVRNNPLTQENKWIQFFSRVNREIGKPQTLFSAFFLWGALNQFGLGSDGFNALLLYWVIFMILNIPAIAVIFNNLFEPKESEKQENALGSILGVQSKNTFLVKLFSERKQTIKLFDFVEFVYSIDDTRQVRKGIILDTYLLNEQQWIKVLTTAEINKIFENKPILKGHTDDIIYKISDVPENEYLETFVGIITENSSIQKIKFVYNSKASVEDGQLLEVRVKGTSVYYQIVEGITRIEQLENKNETGLIVGEAIQLGTWNHEKVRFEQFGWVPEINSPVYISSKIQDVAIADTEFQIGHIPNTNFPVIIDKELALTHHTAVLGVTGTGKSIFARNLIREYLKDETIKVICIDFTGEYKGKFADLTPAKIVAEDKDDELYKTFEWVSNELEKFGNQQDKEKLKKADEFIKSTLNHALETFLKTDDSRISIFELPDVSNTASILEYTRQLFKALFVIAKSQKCFGHKVCIVLEEAHTVIPEWNFVGIADKSSQSLLNSIAQIALQGRKYDVGLMVIAQRTANVSKTVLTQCNTIISFQEFDKTSSEFLSNYFGQGIASVLPNLKFRQAIAAGKALKSNVPMIFEVPEITEPEIEEEKK
ncbi:ATP-binding protein [Flagellimonas aquimarina]|uniref:ATP-binding protein n=1 Tax=Flagellimonas aquimarina TaxID=2201895 RepID=A0A316L4E1_9FLAO|nr:ATP-binding protein [Allomuricauda koreensis]PWL40288.1 ATP-binding protein [Allomuricauda koreensis]